MERGERGREQERKGKGEMMKIKMLTLSAGPEGVLEAGKSYDVDKKFGQALIEGRYAVVATIISKAAAAEKPEMPENPMIETTEAPAAPEKAVSARGKAPSAARGKRRR
jgi:uncharacterized Zn finger protein